MAAYRYRFFFTPFNSSLSRMAFLHGQTVFVHFSPALHTINREPWARLVSVLTRCIHLVQLQAKGCTHSLYVTAWDDGQGLYEVCDAVEESVNRTDLNVHASMQEARGHPALFYFSPLLPFWVQSSDQLNLSLVSSSFLFYFSFFIEVLCSVLMTSVLGCEEFLTVHVP